MSEEAPTCPIPHRTYPERPRRAATGVLVCEGHRRDLPVRIRELGHLHAQLTAHLVARGDGTSDGSRGPSKSTGIALNPPVVAARAEIRNCLVAWVRITLEEGPAKTLPADDVARMTDWLARRSDWLAAQLWIDDLFADVAATTRQARGLVQPNTLYRVEIGPCPEVVLTLHDDGSIESQRCPGQVVAVMHRATSRELLPDACVCTEHGEDEEAPHAWTPSQWHTLGRRMGRTLDLDAADAFVRAVVDGEAGA